MISRISIALLIGAMLALALVGCGPGLNPPADQLAKPRPALMVAPKALPDVPAGEDLYQSNGACSAEYVRETGRLRSLQQYVRTIQKR